MSGPFSRVARATCPRCISEQQVTYPWPFWAQLRNCWCVVVAVEVMFSPILLSDVYVLLPPSLLFVSALGPLNALARIRPTCLRCGCGVEPVQRKAASPHG